MKKTDIIIGIDCDVTKSGVAYLDTATRRLEVSALTFPKLIDYLKFVKQKSDESGQSVVVAVEAGWLNKISNYHTAASRGGQRISKDVGANHEVGKKIIEMCKHYGLEVVEQKPLKKCWKGKERKITHEEIAYFTGLTGTTNQEMRDAALICWNYAGLPIRIKA